MKCCKFDYRFCQVLACSRTGDCAGDHCGCVGPGTRSVRNELYMLNGASGDRSVSESLNVVRQQLIFSFITKSGICASVDDRVYPDV